ncbi:MAG: HPF/RaiA family ribosome-associated protein [Kiritimatiellae bacterium]|nr:HPF/RaiA family ribosome-associated protein [Kiritimatiellia bacterium]MBR1837238.1 HPF/RaiA family ribosome-associated protein [Kiritimatiellia bacterium]
MSVEITIRHLKLSVALQNAARKKADKLSADFPAAEHIRIVFDQDGPKYAVSLSVQGGQKTNVDASAKDADAGAALNAVFDKADAQLRRASKKRQEVRK